MKSTFGRDLTSVPNLITLSRIVLLLTATLSYFYGSKLLALVLAVSGGLSDYADGIVARRTGQVSRLGEILDQFGDLCFESLVLLAAISEGFLPAPVLFVYLFREFWVVSIRRYMAAMGENIASSLPGKLKSNFLCWGFLPTFLAISGKLAVLEPFVTGLAWIGIYGGLVLSYGSAVGYTRQFVAAYDRHNAGRGGRLAAPAHAEKG